MTPTPDPALAARLARLHDELKGTRSPSFSEDVLLDQMDNNCGDGYRSGQLITLADHTDAVQAAVAKAVEAERARVKAAEWEEPDHTTMAHMLGMSAAELSVDLCRLGLFPAVGVDDTGEFVLGPFWLEDSEVIDGSASVHWDAKGKHYYWSAYIDFGTEQIRGNWPIDTIPPELSAAIRARKGDAL